ncbi:MAG: ABC transporter ATP-binding protein, partial [Lachnospiraceae bacterium]|nr:ABC transporter ATP-binding protein [Lachnospiraceae bacterium]
MKRLLKFLKSYRKECVIAPLFKLLEAAFELFVPKVMASIIDVGIKNHDGPYVIKMGLVLVALAIIGLCCAVTAQFFAAKAAVGFSTKLREVLFGHIEDLSFTDIDQAGTSTLITRMTSDVNQVQSGVNMTLRLFLRSPIIVFGAMIMAFTVDVEMAWIFVIAIPILAIIVFGIMLLTMPLYKKVQSGLDKVLGITRENLTGVRVIRAFHQEETEKTRFDESNQALTAMQKFVGRISACMNPVTYVIVNLAIMILIYKGALKVQIGDLSQGQVIAILDYMSMILVELVKLANLIILMTKALACADRVASVLEIGTDVGGNGNDAANGKDQAENGTAEGKSGAQGAAAASDDAQPVETFVGASVAQREDANYLVFDHVAMKYRGAGEETLEDVSFAVRKGDT